MFCIYEGINGVWTAEYIVQTKAKFTAKGKTPTDAMFNLYDMIGKNDETGTDSEVDGSKSLLPSGDSQPPNCS